ncbi:MAG: hypothetical protein VXZ72_01820 [Chlamydiota bacterium]|nr:hypothetical protein [Chlamydiota bacterium]
MTLPSLSLLLDRVRHVMMVQMGKRMEGASLGEVRRGIALALRESLMEQWVKSQEAIHTPGVRRVYYLSMEY